MTDVRSPAGRRRWAVGLRWSLAVLVVLVVAGYVVTRVLSDDGRGRGSAASPVATPGVARPSDLAGEWAGEGTVTRCAGFDRCEHTRTISLTVDCSGKRCDVVPFAPTYGSPPLRFADGRYRAAGPLPAAVAPTCGGAPTSTAQWSLELDLRGGRLTGTYAESTVQSFDCGATGVAWKVSLERRGR